MSTPFEPIPQRIGETERNDAVSLLQEHLGAGRLDHDEFDDRIGKALSAKTNDDLQTLFVDLPGRKPGQQLAVPQSASLQSSDAGASPVQQQGPSWLTPGLVSALVPLAVFFCLATSFRFWWLIPVAAILASALGKRTYDERRSRRRRDRSARRLER